MKGKGKKVIQFIGVVIAVAILLFMLFVDVLAAEGYFGDPEEWTRLDSRSVRRVCGIVALGVFALTGGTEFLKERTRGEIESEASEEYEEHKTAG